MSVKKNNKYWHNNKYVVRKTVRKWEFLIKAISSLTSDDRKICSEMNAYAYISKLEKLLKKLQKIYTFR